MEKCLFLTLRSYLEILIDARIKLANCYHTRPTDVYSGAKVTAHTQVSSSFIGNSALRECRDLLYHIPTCTSDQILSPLFLVRTIVVSTPITDPHSLQQAVRGTNLHGRTLRSRNIILYVSAQIIDRRSISIPCCNWPTMVIRSRTLY